MPSRNRVKQYVSGDYYHIYNRGAEKRQIFLDEHDYQAFIGYLMLYLSPPDPWTRRHKDMSREIELAVYCLMPTHFHLLVRQSSDRAISSFVRCVMNGYVRYFNERYRRVGSLCQDSYKAVRITSDAQLQYAEQYIH